MNPSEDPRCPLAEFTPSCEFFIGIDSDGCVFDTMEVKHKECFIPNIIKHYGLAAISKYVREAAEFINLYSCHRGVNRFPGLVMTMDLVQSRPEVLRRRPRIPALVGLRGWIERETRLSNPVLAAEVKAAGDADLATALAWSEAVESFDRRDRQGRAAFPLRPRVAREHAGQGRRDGRLGDARRGAGRASGRSMAFARWSR